MRLRTFCRLLHYYICANAVGIGCSAEPDPRVHGMPEFRPQNKSESICWIVGRIVDAVVNVLMC